MVTILFVISAALFICCASWLGWMMFGFLWCHVVGHDWYPKLPFSATAVSECRRCGKVHVKKPKDEDDEA